ncbi:hypothetical protein [Stenotrophomonas oahuensis]|uniref:Uncharacterized protein n=1 Tax=Stenotrophomonas oahuensis TaxID=3003271 RepID=A0ABY9YPH1_9GAMM|nr:hypothetical protein [Stenotrophomonas sp. A5586]WNH52809.1 hypothetical protein PDM29_00630 [Stenotrophomonas sp. A5586]
MSELIGFDRQMRFTALHAYSIANGVGGVVAVFFCPAKPEKDTSHRSVDEGHSNRFRGDRSQRAPKL